MSAKFGTNKGLITEGDRYDTGIRVRGYAVLGIPPNRYRHYTTFVISHPDVFPTESYQDGEFLGRPSWEVGFVSPDGTRQSIYGSYRSREEAEEVRLKYPTARLTGDLRVGYKRDGRFTDKANGDPWGIAESCRRYVPMNFALTAAEAAVVLEFRETVDAEWNRQAQDFIRRERERTEAVARAAALDDLPPAVLNALYGPTECLECGAVYAEPGRVRDHGMACDRCDV